MEPLGARRPAIQRPTVTKMAFVRSVADVRRGHLEWARCARSHADRLKRRASCSARLHHLPQHVLQDSAVAEILELVERVDPAEQLDLVHLAGGSMDPAGELAARLQALGHAE